MAKRRKPARKRQARGSTDSSSVHNSVSSEHTGTENGAVTSDDSVSSAVAPPESEGELGRSRVGSVIVEEGEEESTEGLLRLPEMTDTSMSSVGQPLRDVMDRLNGSWEDREAKGEEEERNGCVVDPSSEPPTQQPFREDSEGKPPDPAPGQTSVSPLDDGSNSLQASAVSTDSGCFAPLSPDLAHTSGGHNDSAEQSQSQTLSGSLEDDEGAEAPAGQKPHMKEKDKDPEQEAAVEETLSPSEVSHPAEFK